MTQMKKPQPLCYLSALGWWWGGNIIDSRGGGGHSSNHSWVIRKPGEKISGLQRLMAAVRKRKLERKEPEPLEAKVAPPSQEKANKHDQQEYLMSPFHIHVRKNRNLPGNGSHWAHFVCIRYLGDKRTLSILMCRAPKDLLGQLDYLETPA